jgi:hypothetical protein
MYSDFNVITTPLFFEIGAIILKILGANIFSFRIYNTVIFGLLFLSIYILLKKLKFQKNFCLLITLFCIVLFWPYIKVGANYNTLALAMYIFGILNANTIIENAIIKNDSKQDKNINENIKVSKIKKSFINLKDWKNYILQGTIIFAIFFTKQNIGIYYIVSLAIFNFCMLGKKIIPSIKLLIKESTTFFIEGIILCIILVQKGNFFNMIDYAFLGMQEFTTENFFMTTEIFYITIIYLLEIFLCNIIYLVLIKEKSLQSTVEKSLIIFSIFLNLTMFPIINYYHITYAIVLNILMFFIVIRCFYQSKVNEKIRKIILKGCIVLFSVIYSIINIINIIDGLKLDKNEFNLDKESVYYLSYMDLELKNKIENVCFFILESKENGKNVIIFSNEAALYMTNLKINNGDFDLPFLGNLGKDGLTGLIKKIDELENTYVLIPSETYWQISEKAKDEIINVSSKIGTIEDFTIYEK